MCETILSSILPHIFEIILTIISLVVARYAIPYIKTDLIPWLKEKRLLNIIKNLVKAAEKMAESGAIEKGNKNDFVVSLLEKNGIIVDATVKAFIEGCVKELDIIGSTIYEEVLEEESNEN